MPASSVPLPGIAAVEQANAGHTWPITTTGGPLYITYYDNDYGGNVGPGTRFCVDTTPPPGCAGSQTVDLQVSATTPWFDTGVDVIAGTPITVQASGTVVYGGADGQTADANGGDIAGVKRFPDDVLPDTITHSLIGKIGGTAYVGTGAPLQEGTPGGGQGFVGTSYSQVVPASGRLYLGYNDEVTAFSDNTQAGQTIGTPAYMAPEQVKGVEVGPSTDLYALGLVMAEALSGRIVFQGDSGMAVCIAQIADAPVPLTPDVLSSPLGPVIVRATQKTPALRYPSAEMMRGDVLAILAHLPVDARASKPKPIAPLGASSSLAYAPTGLGPTPQIIATTTAPTTQIRAAPGSQRGLFKWLLAAAAIIAAGALVVIAVALVGGHVPARIAGVARKPASHAPLVRDRTDAFPNRHVSTIGTKAMRARIEAAGFMVRQEQPIGANMTWTVEGSGAQGGLVMLYVFREQASFQPLLERFREMDGYCARDATALLFVDVNDEAASFALLDQITR